MIYFKEGGWFLPDGEAHLQDWMRVVDRRVNGRLGYQYHKYEIALHRVRPERRVAVDIGAHVGLWSFHMSRDFQKLVAFEPMPAHRACWERNMEGSANVDLYPYALGAPTDSGLGPRHVRLRTRTPDSSGDTGVEPDENIPGTLVELRTLDSFDLDNVDFIKIDCEGYELFVLQGAVETLKRCKPCVIVEQKPETGGAARYGIGVTDGVAFLESLGAQRRGAIAGDYILSWG